MTTDRDYLDQPDSLIGRHCIARAYELTAGVGAPLRDRYGYAIGPEDVLAVLRIVWDAADTDTACSVLGMACALGDLELAMGYDTPTDEDYERRIVAALEMIVRQRQAVEQTRHKAAGS